MVNKRNIALLKLVWCLEMNGSAINPLSKGHQCFILLINEVIVKTLRQVAKSVLLITYW